MGVSGSGKSTIGKKLANELDFQFFDGDDYHPESNVQKMKSGTPLNDDDRKGWLEKLNQLGLEHQTKGAVIACSALKEKYRAILLSGLKEKGEIIYLKGSFKEIKLRLEERKGHFMPINLLKSQFETLEEPKNVITVSIVNPPEKIISQILEYV